VLVILHGIPAYGAVEHYVAAIVGGLRGSDEEVVLVYPDAPELAPFAELAGGNVRVVTFPVSDLSGPAPRLAARLARLLRDLQPRVVHVTEVWPTAQIAARLARVPRVLVTHHTPELPRSDGAFGRVWLRLGWLMRPEVIYTSESDRATDGRSLRTHVVPLGIDLERFADPRPALARDRPIIGNVARLALQKGHRVLIEAAPRVLAKHPGVSFVIVGEGELRGELEQQLNDAGLGDRFELLGARDDIPELLASFDVFAFPSFFEGLCVAVIEAQAVGVPVVATGVGGLVETVVPGETGVRCELGDAVSLADGINWVLDHPDQAAVLAGEAKRRVHERFSAQRMVDETLRLYR
jgi:glycosyltransferase involved in cell wall biosynthesis